MMHGRKNIKSEVATLC